MAVDKILQRYTNGERSFTHIDLLEAELINVNLSGADFSYADFRQARLGRTNFIGTNFRGADLSEARFRNPTRLLSDKSHRS
jgi:uncharacterized protein YjbI with pentapeptide repeats